MVKLKGSSMIEVIIASLIFLVVFICSLSTLTALTLRSDEGYVLLEAERALTDCSRRYGTGEWAEGTYTDTYEWGGIVTVIATYDDYDNIQQMLLRADLKGSRKTIEQRQLIKLANE